MKNASLPCFMLLFLIIISGCASQPQKSTPLPFETAVRIMTEHLFEQVAQHSFLSAAQNTVFVIDPIIDADTGEITSISQKIAELMAKEAQNENSRFVIKKMTQENLTKAGYVITGVMQLTQYENWGAKIPHLIMSIVNAESGQVVAHSDVWISNAKLEFKPAPLYQDSPMYIKDRRVDALIATARSMAGDMAHKEYFDNLTVGALLDEAGTAYDNGDYKLALGLFAKTAGRDDGQVMKTYSGLYQAFFKLGDMESAENAFSTLTKFGLKFGKISVKFLFDVNNVDFFRNDKLQEYPIWLRQIAKNISESDVCVKIVGHASRSGSEEYNRLLSRKRADHIQRLLGNEEKDVLQKTRTEGVGFAENIIGTGTDDARDAIDRRVEFKVLDCNVVAK